VHAGQVVGAGLAHRPDEAVAVGEAGQPGQQLAHLCARNGRRDRLEGPANLDGRFGFHVPGIDMAGAPLLHDEDTRAIGAGA